MRKLIFILLFIGCAKSEISSRKITLGIFNDKKQAHKYYRISLDVPSGYQYSEVRGHGTEYRFTYIDASVIYISDEHFGNFNDSIIEHNSSLKKTRDDVKYLDSIVYLRGIDKNGLYWMEVGRKNLRLGFYKVSLEKLSLFEEIISKANKKINR